MTTAEACEETIVQTGPRLVQTGAADDASLAVSAPGREANQEGWQRIIDADLVEWGRDPSQLEDENITAPSRVIIARASALAIGLRDEGWPPPNRVVPSGDGGIVLERWSGSVFESIEVRDDGAIVVSLFEDSRLVATEQLV